MQHPANPFSLRNKIEPALTLVLAYWQSLKRAENSMPFWDDVAASSLPDLADRLLLIKASAKPERFRLESVGQRLTERYGTAVAGKFIDEMDLRSPFEYLRSQCSATVESRAPTYYPHREGNAETSDSIKSYSRLLLPLWGDGHVGTILGAVEWHL